MRRCQSLSAACLGLLALLVLGGCPPKYPKCDGDKDCKAKEFCVNGTCQQCRSDQDCPGGKCVGGRCEPVSSGCSDDSQCPDNQSCIDGKCRPCATDDQCGEGGKCNRGRCQRAPQGSGRGTGTGGDCQLEAVYFDFNESALSSEATSAIERDAECLKKSSGKSVTLVGHSDPRGTEEYNLALSDRRAQSVRERLSRIGAQSGVKVVPKGELEATGTDEGSWAKDRRVDVRW